MEFTTESLLAVTSIVSLAAGFLIRSPVMKLVCEVLEKIRGEEKRNRRRDDPKPDRRKKPNPPEGSDS